MQEGYHPEPWGVEEGWVVPLLVAIHPWLYARYRFTFGWVQILGLCKWERASPAIFLEDPHEKNSRMTEAFPCKHLYHCYITTIIIILGCFSTLTRMSKISQEGLEGFARSLLIHKAMMEIKASSRSEK